MKIGLMAATLAVAFFMEHGALASAVVQSYPTKTLRFIVPFAPGGGTDVLARLVAAKASETIGEHILIDNRIGASGNIGAEIVAQSAPDGYSLFMVNMGHAISASLYRKLNYDLLEDFIPVTELASTSFMLTVSSNVPVSSVEELIAFAKARPGQLNYGTAGIGSAGHMATELFNLMAGLDIKHIPYKGAALGPVHIQ